MYLVWEKQWNQRVFQSCRFPEQRNSEWKEKVSMGPHNILFSCMLALLKTSPWGENANVLLEIRQQPFSVRERKACNTGQLLHVWHLKAHKSGLGGWKIFRFLSEADWKGLITVFVPKITERGEVAGMWKEAMSLTESVWLFSGNKGVMLQQKPTGQRETNCKEMNAAVFTLPFPSNF